jgi:hypothetical protein
MKKTYINPEMEIIKVQTQQMIATSAGFGSGQKDGGVAAGRDLFLDFED